MSLRGFPAGITAVFVFTGAAAGCEISTEDAYDDLSAVRESVGR